MTARASVRVGTDRLHVVVRPRAVAVGVAGALLASALVVVSLGMGEFPLAPHEVVAALPVDGRGHLVVVGWRLPRALGALALGCGLGLAGALFQTVTRNPLASPDVVGLANGSFTGMLLALALGTADWSTRTAGAVAGGLAAALAIWLLSHRGAVQGFRLIIVGIGVSAMLAAVNTWLLLRLDLDTAMFAAAWGAGTLHGVTADEVAPASAATALLVAAALALGTRLRQVDLGDDLAAATGVAVDRTRSLALLVAVLLVCVATAVVGPIAFVALAAPQIARRLARSPSLPLALSGVVGGAMLLASDVVAQHLLPVTLPAGVVTVSVGGAYLVALVAREVRRR